MMSSSSPSATPHDNNRNDNSNHHQRSAANASAVDQDDREDWQIQRDVLKQNGDHAFQMKAYKTAISEYSSAIALDPDFVVLYSNRSAAYLANSEISKALQDAQQCVSLDNGFLKGHSRLAAALLSLRRHQPALESYQHVLSKDPNNVAAKNGKEICERELQKIGRPGQGQGEQQEELLVEKEAKNDRSQPVAEAEGKGDVEDEVEEDDLLDDFFNDVEEVVAKKKKTKEESMPFAKGL
jgi:tetratricopeptide (TPR) repeat protein